MAGLFWIEGIPMDYFVSCPKCKLRFALPFAKSLEMAELIEGTMTVDVECPECDFIIACIPREVLAQQATDRSEEEAYRCPVSRCAGYVVYVDGEDEDPFWGCGECGSIWYNQQTLFRDIARIVQRFHYRRRCYRNVKGEWRPGDPTKEPRDYDRKVESEPEDDSDEFVRG